MLLTYTAASAGVTRDASLEKGNRFMRELDILLIHSARLLEELRVA